MSKRCACSATGLRGRTRCCARRGSDTGVPIAVTEAHLGVHARAAASLAGRGVAGRPVSCAGEGADVVAVTAWSAFGAHDWSLAPHARRRRVRAGPVRHPRTGARPTALARMVRVARVMRVRTIIPVAGAGMVAERPRGSRIRPSRRSRPPRRNATSTARGVTPAKERPVLIVGARGRLAARSRGPARNAVWRSRRCPGDRSTSPTLALSRRCSNSCAHGRW